MSEATAQEGYNPDNPFGGGVAVNTQNPTKEEPKETPKEAPKEEAPTEEPKSEEQETENEVPAMPEGGQEKFYNSETGEYNWEAHARELAWKESQRSKKTEPKKPETKKAEGEENKTEEQQQVSNVLEAAGLDEDALGQKVLTQGGLDDSDYEALENVGVPRSLVDSYIQGINAQARLYQSQMIEYIGGAEDAQELLDWAGNNLDEAEIDSYNEALKTPNWKMAIDALKARRGGNASPKLATGQPARTEEGFGNFEEQIKAQQDPRYWADPEYRQQVWDKIARSA